MYILGGGATVAVVVGSSVPFALPTAPAGALTAAGLGAARSKRLRQRGHQEGSPANRAPQFGHACTMNLSARRTAKLSLKPEPRASDPAVVTLVVALPLALLFGYLCYREAGKHKSRYGTSPWNLSPEVWGVIVFLTGVLGILLLWLAIRAGRKEHAGPEAVPMARGGGRAGSVL